MNTIASFLTGIICVSLILFVIYFPKHSLAVENTSYEDGYSQAFKNAQTWVDNTQHNSKGLNIPVVIRDITGVATDQGIEAAVYCPPPAAKIPLCKSQGLNTKNGLIVVNSEFLGKIKSLPEPVRKLIAGSIVVHEQTHAYQYHKNNAIKADYYDEQGRVDISKYLTSPEETAATAASFEYIADQTVGTEVEKFTSLLKELTQKIKTNSISEDLTSR